MDLQSHCWRPLRDIDTTCLQVFVMVKSCINKSIYLIPRTSAFFLDVLSYIKTKENISITHALISNKPPARIIREKCKFFIRLYSNDSKTFREVQYSLLQLKAQNTRIISREPPGG